MNKKIIIIYTLCAIKWYRFVSFLQKYPTRFGIDCSVLWVKKKLFPTCFHMDLQYYRYMHIHSRFSHSQLPFKGVEYLVQAHSILKGSITPPLPLYQVYTQISLCGHLTFTAQKEREKKNALPIPQLQVGAQRGGARGSCPLLMITISTVNLVQHNASDPPPLIQQMGVDVPGYNIYLQI